MCPRRNLALALAPLLATVAAAIPAGAPAKDGSSCAATLRPAEVQDGWRATATLTCDAARPSLPVGTRLLLGLTLVPASPPGDYEDHWERYEIDLPVHVFTLAAAAPRAEVTFETSVRFVPDRTIVKLAVWPLTALRPCDGNRDGCLKFGFVLDSPERDDASPHTWESAACDCFEQWTFHAKTGAPTETPR